MSIGLDEESPADAIVVKEDAGVVHVTWAFLVIVVLGGLWALHTFVDSTESFVPVDIVGGLLAAIFVAGWIYEGRHPARLEISRASIVQRRRGRKRSVVLERTTGEFTFEIRSELLGEHTTVAPVLVVPDGDGTEIGMSSYDRQKVQQACEALGWHLVPPR